MFKWWLEKATTYYVQEEIGVSKAKTIETKTEELLAPIVERFGVRIYDVEYVKEGADFYLRCYIDKDGGVNIDDCENVSRTMSESLDKDDFIEDAYILEVSSPGLGRNLKKDRHFDYCMGEEVEVKTYKPIDKQKEFVGILGGYDENTITIKIPKPKTEDEFTDMVFDRKDIANIKLTLDF